MNVLLVTRSGDELATLPVAEALRRRGARPWIFESNRFPGQGGLTWRGPQDGWLDLPEGRLELAELDAAWLRREQVGSALPAEWPPDLGAAVRLEAGDLFRGALHDTGAFLLDPPAVYERARVKPWQLLQAQAAGLEVPDTLESNDPEAVRAFADAHPEGIIAKMYNDFRLGDRTVYTNVLGPEDLAALDSLSACPMIFQAAVPKAQELRVVVIGEQVWGAALPTATLAGAEQDWRRVGAATLHLWRPVELPEAVRAGMLRLHDRLGTNYGSADFVQTPDGRLVFLENNTVGESFWMYDMFGLPDALAGVLTGQLSRRAPPPELR